MLRLRISGAIALLSITPPYRAWGQLYLRVSNPRHMVTFVDCICTIKTAQLFRQLHIQITDVCPRAVRKLARSNRCYPLRRYTNDLQAMKWQKRERAVLFSAPQCPKECCFMSAVLTVGCTDPLIDFRGSVNLDGEKLQFISTNRT